MALQRRTHTKDKSNLIHAFGPFVHPQNYEGMIVGNDLDSILSACFLKGKFGWDIVGTYDYKTLWFPNGRKDFLDGIEQNRFIAIDLDIYHPNLFSLGHHILEHTERDRLPGHARTLNPNFIRGINVSNFRRKYPLGTIHFLLWLFEIESLSRECELTVWLADSSFINGQSHKFGRNVAEWIENYLDLSLFKHAVGEIDTLDFEKELSQTILAPLRKLELGQSSGQVASRHLKLSGYQCQWADPNRQRRQIHDLFEVVSKLTGWPTPGIPSRFDCIEGQRAKIPLSNVLKRFGSLDDFLEQEKVFSYVFPYQDSINYTTGII